MQAYILRRNTNQMNLIYKIEHGIFGIKNATFRDNSHRLLLAFCGEVSIPAIGWLASRQSTEEGYKIIWTKVITESFSKFSKSTGGL